MSTSKRVITKEEFVALTGNGITAMALNQMIYWSERVRDAEQLREEERERLAGGECAFIHGWILIARAASQGQPPGGTGKGLMHVFGGILAMNIVRTLDVIHNTFYGTG